MFQKINFYRLTAVSRQLSSVIPACPESKRSKIPDPRQARTGSAGMTIQPPDITRLTWQ